MSLRDFPEEEVAFKDIALYTCSVLRLQGSLDEVVPLESAEYLLSLYRSAKKENIVLKGVNHNFSKINSIETDKAKKLYVESIIDFLK